MILVSVINHNALPVTKESDNNIYVDHYIWTFQVLKSQRVGYPNIVNLEVVTLTGRTNTLRSTHNHNTFWVNLSWLPYKKAFPKKLSSMEILWCWEIYFFILKNSVGKIQLFLFVFRRKKKNLYLGSIIKKNFKKW